MLVKQRVQEKNQAYGNSCWRGGLLSTPGIYFFNDGITLAIKPDWKSAQQLAIPQRSGVE